MINGPPSPAGAGRSERDAELTRGVFFYIKMGWGGRDPFLTAASGTARK